ncbi:hypothetical protein HMPREF1544_08865 [Mucor circinelloides 1006PhL]|uniref:Uncharacterized protein n=1 Tax=Mucor circinelloides f. circinelloides (strain 1006PhL) TaxID=1220926 RepID=S2J2T3_MUCC1|nr:hypothetical protein HMPREF1544_08865 [Mucor circinelloides 1006PhL]
MPQVLATTVNFSHSLVIVNSMGIFQLATVTNISNLCTAVRFASLRNPLVSSIGKKKVGRAFQHLAKTHPLVEACSQEIQTSKAWEQSIALNSENVAPNVASQSLEKLLLGKNVNYQDIL